MSLTLKEAHTEFSVQATVLCSGLSRLTRTKSHRLFTDLPYGWRLSVDVPVLKDAPDDEISYAGVFVWWPQSTLSSPDAYPDLQTTFQLVSLGSDCQFKTHALRIPSTAMTNPRVKGYGTTTLMPWEELWTVCSRAGGFQVKVDISPATDAPSETSCKAPEASPPPIPILSHPAVLHNLFQQIEGKSAVNVQFVLFSRRHKRETVVRGMASLPVFASREIIEGHSKLLDALTLDTSSDAAPSEWPVSCNMDAAEYDYSSDSDLEEDADAESPDIDMEVSDGDSGSINQDPPRYDAILQTSARSLANPPRVVYVKDVAYKTWKAMIYYLYSSNITFAPLSSRKIGVEKTALPSIATSPKSTYRLAKKLGIESLCSLAKAEIESQLSEDIIVEEMFSKFTSQFVDIRKMELEFMLKHWDQVKTSAALQSIMMRTMQGELPHAADVVLDIIRH
ncbi:hypothetical protein PLICRDRAFT_58201 [Plicaturopsis crispa FD-325 SS-3]|uniref:BTB domain-containing protein n=1 Tax=Plicaturopsis crispa FD-325 SS-3 TaxID=944288 RepID=A0A0C9T3B1_PLICR|nr:hypothetical protein PLICRDRAFT_58201 [Plicaturopsis crispa FD-325 SS-3]